MKNRLTTALSTLAVIFAFGCGGRATSDAKSSDAGNGTAGSSGGSTGGDSIGGGSVGGSAGTATLTSCTPTRADAGSSATPSASAPLNHRPSACCSAQRGPGPATQPYSRDMAAFSADGGVACMSDAQCVSGANGRCFPFEGLVGPGGCSYDECGADSDCASGGACVCRTSPSDNDATVCAPKGNCRVDADCGSDGYCSPSRTDCNGTVSYFCRTPGDTCLNDSECEPAGPVPCCDVNSCAYDPQAQHWACNQITCLPP